MPWIREVSLSDPDARILVHGGVMMERRFWNENEAPHTYLGAFSRADHILSADFDERGRVTVVKKHYTETGAARSVSTLWMPRDVIACVATSERPGIGLTYTHHDDRLIIPGGYLQAHAGTMHQVWTAFRREPGGDTLLADGVSVAEGRAAITRSLTV